MIAWLLMSQAAMDPKEALEYGFDTVHMKTV